VASSEFDVRLELPIELEVDDVAGEFPLATIADNEFSTHRQQEFEMLKRSGCCGEQAADDLPRDYPGNTSESSTDYDMVKLRGLDLEFLLPVRAEFIIGNRRERKFSRNVIYFKFYRKFETDIKFQRLCHAEKPEEATEAVTKDKGAGKRKTALLTPFPFLYFPLRLVFTSVTIPSSMVIRFILHSQIERQVAVYFAIEDGVIRALFHCLG